MQKKETLQTRTRKKVTMVISGENKGILKVMIRSKVEEDLDQETKKITVLIK